MHIETQTASSERQEIPVRFTKRGKAVLGLLGAGLAVSGTAVGIEVNTPGFEGDKIVTITEANVTDIAMNHVDGAENDIRATVDKIVEMNPDVFQDGEAFVEHEDAGKTIEIPASVDK